jgi:hypothetical protein
MQRLSQQTAQDVTNRPRDRALQDHLKASIVATTARPSVLRSHWPVLLAWSAGLVLGLVLGSGLWPDPALTSVDHATVVDEW